MSKHSPNTQSTKLLAMSERVGQVAESLARLALEGDGSDDLAPSRSDEEISAEIVSRLIRMRQSRVHYMPAALILEPVWDITLCLLHAEIAGTDVPASAIAELTGLPGHVASRWLAAMADHGLIRLGKTGIENEESVVLAPNVAMALRRHFREAFEDR